MIVEQKEGQQNQQQRLIRMDPRPYHFQYRRPRMSNPTFESLKLYESIYQLDKFKKVNPQYQIKKSQNQNTQESTIQTPQSETERMHRHQSSDFRQSKKPALDRYSRNSSQDKSQIMNSSMSQYGNHLMKGPPLDQNRIYEKQERAYNIISYYPKAYTPKLKNFPRLTLENQLIERGGFQQRQA